MAFREFEVVENTLSDPVLIGAAVLAKGYKGRFNYLLPGEYAENQEHVFKLPKTSEICITYFHKKVLSAGKVVIRFNY